MASAPPQRPEAASPSASFSAIGSHLGGDTEAQSALRLEDVAEPEIIDARSTHEPTTTSATPAGPEILTGEEDLKFWITDFGSFPGTGLRYCGEEFALKDLFTPGDPMIVFHKMNHAWDNSPTVKGLKSVEDNTKFRWIHLPDNNVQWVQKVLLNLRAHLTNESVADGSRSSSFSTPEFFEEHTNSFGKSHLHARYMRPLCQRWISKDNTQTEMVLMMPYVHHEKIQSYAAMRDLVELSQNGENLPSTASSRDKLFYSHLAKSGRLQIRRSLDQAFYWTLKDTRRRDEDQVIDRYAKEHLGQSAEQRSLLMVDQLWLWLLNEDKNDRTVVTCFPRIWNPGAVTPGDTTDPARRDDPRTAPNDPLDIFDQIFHFLNRSRDKAGRYQSVTDLCCLLIDRCAGNIIDGKLTQDVDRQFIEFYNRYVDELMDKQKICLEELDERLSREIAQPGTSAEPSDLNLNQPNVSDTASRPPTAEQTTADDRPKESIEAKGIEEPDTLAIAHDFKILKNVRDIIEELSMMSHVVGQQREAIASMGHEYRHQSHGNTEGSISLPGFNEKISFSQAGSKRAGDAISQGMSEEYDGRRRRSLPPQRTPDKSTFQSDQLRSRVASQEGDRRDTQQKLITSALQNRVTPKELQRLGVRAFEREVTLHNLREKARAAEKSITHLLDLKQRQTSVLESRMSRRIAQASEKQSEAVMLFTIVTIIFLPMSTLASMFGMNAREFGQGETPLSHIWSVLFGISIPLTISILYLAFHRRFRRVLILIPEYLWRSTTHWFCFHWLISLEDRLDVGIEDYKRKNKKKQDARLKSIAANKTIKGIKSESSGSQDNHATATQPPIATTPPRQEASTGKRQGQKSRLPTKSGSSNRTWASRLRGWPQGTSTVDTEAARGTG